MHYVKIKKCQEMTVRKLKRLKTFCASTDNNRLTEGKGGLFLLWQASPAALPDTL